MYIYCCDRCALRRRGLGLSEPQLPENSLGPNQSFLVHLHEVPRISCPRKAMRLL